MSWIHEVEKPHFFALLSSPTNRGESGEMAVGQNAQLNCTSNLKKFKDMKCKKPHLKKQNCRNTSIGS